MTNPSKAKGTSYENELLADLRKIWPDIDRAKSCNESNDFTGPFPIEAKHRKAWDIRGWVRKIENVSMRRGPFMVHVHYKQWAIFAADGDRRLKTSIPDIMIVPREFGMYLLYLYAQHGYDGVPVAFSTAEPVIPQDEIPFEEAA